MVDSKRKWYVRLAWTLALGWLLYGVYTDLDARYRTLVRAGNLPKSLIVVAAFLLGFTALYLLFVWRPRLFAKVTFLRARLVGFCWLAAAAVAIFASWFFLYTKWSDIFSGAYLRLMFYLAALGVMSWLLTREEAANFNWQGLQVAGVLMGGIFLFAQALQTVRNYPFSLAWSEGNRLWDYSVLYGRNLYDYPGGPYIFAYIDKGRQSLWGIPFLIPGVSILFVRLWSALVFTIPYILLGLFIFDRRRTKSPALWLLAGFWTYLFLDQGPIYTPLVLAAILVAAARRKPLVLAVLLTALAGYYAQYTRFTWMFAPGIWAVMAAMVESRPDVPHPARARWGRAIALGLAGLLGGYVLPNVIQTWLVGAQPAQSILSVEGLSEATGRQPLLWERLWPNPTYPPGIVLGLLMAVVPLVVVLLVFAGRRRWVLDFWQKATLLVALLAFLVVGLIVSVKIGGGGNLHNLDMFLIGLLFTAGLAWEAGAAEWITAPERKWWFNLLLTVLVFLPFFQRMMNAQLKTIPPEDVVQKTLVAVQNAVDKGKQSGDVLFIDQRQLLTFGFVKDVRLIPEYEKKYMMDEAMAENAAYFQQFNRDLASHRFSVIVSEPLWINYRGGEYHFGDENDAWVKWVSVPVLCYYEPAETFMETGVQLLVPRQQMLQEGEVVCPIIE